MSKQSDIVKVSQGAAGDPLFIDTANNRVGVGTSLPPRALTVSGSDNATNFEVGDASIGASFNVYNNTTNNSVSLGTGGSSISLAVAGSDKMYIDSAGRVTMPYQPHFWVKANYGAHTVLSNESPNWSVVYENNGGHFNTSTNTFTAPVSGRYFFGTHALIDKSQNGGSNYAYTGFALNGTLYDDVAHTPSNGTTSYMDISISLIVYLSAGDTIQARYNTLSGARFYAGTTFNSFTGHLIG